MNREDGKLCPLQSIGRVEPVPCAKELCAWWDEAYRYGSCCIASSADACWRAASQIADLPIAMKEMLEDVPASVSSTDGDRDLKH